MTLLRCTMTLLCIATAGAACAQARSALPDPQAVLSEPRLAQALKSGGLTLYFRHAATDFSQTDRNRTAFDDCSTQRNLSEAGRRDARAVGEAAVIRGDGTRWVIVARIRVEDWPALVALGSLHKERKGPVTGPL